jgi:class 3 adenylate cyclase
VAETFSKTVAAPGRLARNTSVATRLSLVVVLVALVSLVITSVVGLLRGTELAEDVLRDRLASTAAARADEVERYVGSLQRSMVGQAISPSTASAIGQFDQAYRELQAEDASLDDEAIVDEYYQDVVAPELSEARARPVSAANLVPRDPAAVRLQANYVVPAGEDGSLIVDAGDGSSWSGLHRSLHQPFDDLTNQLGVDDYYLIEPENNIIVYSTAKEIDFATSLLTGPQSGSALAGLINSFGPDPEAEVAAIADFTSYPAAGDDPSAFVASPVFADGALAGYVAVRIGTDQISSLTTNDGSFVEQGDTGETYVVARDDLMRSDARGLIEDPESYIGAVRAAGTATDEQLASMELFDTTVTFQPVDGTEVDEALDGEPDLVETTNYLGDDVLQARRALDIEGLEWAMFAEIQQLEIEQPIADFVRNLLITIGLFLVTVTFLAVRWSDRLLQPLRIISARLRAVRAGGDTEAGLSSALLPEGSATEFVELGQDIDTMLETLEQRNAAAEDRASERRRLLRRILPPQAAQRAEAGERDVVDQVAHASVAVLVIRGLGDLLHTGSRSDARALLDRFIEETDTLAKQRGLERIRLTGDAYFAACGTVRPAIDHAARAVAFALDVQDLVRDLADDEESRMTMSAGVDAGPVTVGLTAGSGLIYDAWGVTVQGAADLARRARPSTVVVSAAVRGQLPSSFVTDEVDGPGQPPGARSVSGRTSERDPA